MTFAMQSRERASAAGAAGAARAAPQPASHLRIGQPDDAAEREADCVANAVTRGDAHLDWSFANTQPARSLQRACDCDGTGQCAECRDRALRLKPVGDMQPDLAPPIVHEVLRSPGRALTPVARSPFESRFRHDFSRVRIHTDALAAASARSVDAQAYTIGEHIVFGARRFTPETESGRRLIAHELAHVVQQTGRGTGRTSLESEAEARASADGPGSIPTLGRRPKEIARAPPGPLPTEVPLTDKELLDLLVNQRGFAFSKPGTPTEDPAGVGRGVGPQAGGGAAGQAVFAAVQITDRDGKLVDRSVAAYFNRADEHAEQQALENLERVVAGRDLEGGEILVVVDQLPCGPGKSDCAGAILAFARRFKLRPRIRVPTGPSVRPGAPPGTTVTPRTAARRSQRTDMPEVELRDFQPGETPDGPGGGGATVVEPSAAPAPSPATGSPSAAKTSELEPLGAAPRPTPPDVVPPGTTARPAPSDVVPPGTTAHPAPPEVVPPGTPTRPAAPGAEPPGLAGRPRFGAGLREFGGQVAAGVLLGLLHSYLQEKLRESVQEDFARALQRRLDEQKTTIAQIYFKNPTSQVFARVTYTASETVMYAAPGDEPALGHGPIAVVPHISLDSFAIQTDYKADEHSTSQIGPSFFDRDYTRIEKVSYSLEVPADPAELEKLKNAERIRQNAERLRRLEQEQQRPAPRRPAPVTPPSTPLPLGAEPQQMAPGVPQSQGTDLLPGAPGPDVNRQAEAASAVAAKQAQNLLDRGARIEQMGSPSKDDLDRWSNAEATWRASVEIIRDALKQDDREYASKLFDDLLNTVGARLAEMRSRLGR
jgi:hypothetical protein